MKGDIMTKLVISLIAVFSGLDVLFMLCACKISGRISRMEEQNTI